MNRRARTVRWTAFAGLAIATGTVIALAGPLDPPAGPVAPTGKTLTEVEPRIAVNATNTPGDADSLFKITQPGSYYLTGNITGVVGKHGIEIVASGVALDLSGFDLAGVPGSLDGVATTSSSLTHITIRNGSVRGWSGDGIDLATFLCFNCAVHDVRSSSNSGVGIVMGNAYLIERCLARANGAGGFGGQGQGMASDCEAMSNTGTGMSMGQGASVINCTATGNTGAASDGIVVGGFGGAVRGCVVKNNGANGIVVQNGTGVTVSDCNLSTNTLAGIQAGGGTLIVRCNVNFSQTFNIIAADECTVADCTVGLGNQGGIQCANRCVVRGNSCARNSNGSATGPNILATGTDNLIEDNNCGSAFRGIKVDAAGNFVARNTCAANNQNYELVAGNACLVVNAALAGAILGSAGGVSPGSTDPNANFSY